MIRPHKNWNDSRVKKYEREETILRSYCIVRMLGGATFGEILDPKNFFSGEKKKIQLDVLLCSGDLIFVPVSTSLAFFPPEKSLTGRKGQHSIFKKKF